MAIASISFLIFCVLAMILFLVFPPKHRWISLLISSIAFYVYASKSLLLFSLVSTLVIYLAAKAIDRVGKNLDERIRNEKPEKAVAKEWKSKAAARKKAILVLALILNVGTLVAFKVLGHFTAAFMALAGLFLEGEALETAKLLTPMGISYYTFSMLGYLLDVYWKRYDSEKNPFRLYLYAVYFPHIVQGPISRYPRLGAELKKPELRLRWDNFVIGMESILLGCFKKLVIADRAGVFVRKNYGLKGHTGGIYIMACVMDAIQIYMDFSGYMDIVSGVSRLFDVELEPNFNHPFLAKSVPEFWRRWHMSLGGWFKDYVYYPVNLSRPVKRLTKSSRNMKNVHIKNMIAVIIPVMTTWVLTGLWHGTGIGYVLWGLYYGTLILLSVTFAEDIQKLWKKLKINTESLWFRILQVIKIFCIFMGGRFLASEVKGVRKLEMLKNIFVHFRVGNLIGGGLGRINLFILFVSMSLMIAIAIIETKESVFAWFNRQNKIVCALILYILFFAVFILGVFGTNYDTKNFMYQRF